MKVSKFIGIGFKDGQASYVVNQAFNGRSPSRIMASVKWAASNKLTQRENTPI
jgi:hypothetical protein